MSFIDKLSANFSNMIEVFPDAMIGWLGVFVVTGVIILSIWLLDTLTSKK